MNIMLQKLVTLYPELAMLVGAAVCLMAGLSRHPSVRRMTAWLAAAAMVIAGLLACRDMLVRDAGMQYIEFTFAGFVKLAVCAIGLLLLMLAAHVPDRIKATHDAERDAAHGKAFEPTYAIRGEFFAFFLLSLTGAMLCAGADDLVWLFLALELTSLPTYVMIATTKDQPMAREATVKYFFLGALAAAVFLYGFSLIYGATGYTQFNLIAAYIATDHANATLLSAGVILALLGFTFKIAAVPMHFYAADVYQGANTPMTTFLSFVPKTAGFIAMIALLNLYPESEPLPKAITLLLWITAAVTMTTGNVLGVVQSNVKRALAYSSIAHSGYMIVALLLLHDVGVQSGGPLGNGVAAILFYLVTYGLGSVASLGVLSVVQSRGNEAQTYDDISGLVKTQPLLASVLLVGVLSLLGFPLMAGFVGKIYLFGSAISQGYVTLVVLAVLNSAISAGYYLRIAGVAFLGQPNEQTMVIRNRPAGVSIVLAMIVIIALGLSPLANKLVEATNQAASQTTNQVSVHIKK